MFEKVFSGNLAKHLENNAKEFPSEIAIISDAKPHLKKSFEELHKDVIYCSSYFKKRGVQKKDRTLLMVRPGYELIVCCFALLYIGAIPIIIDPGMGIRSLLKCIKKSNATNLIGIGIAVWMSSFFKKSFKALQRKVLVTKDFLKVIKSSFDDGGVKICNAQDDDLAAIVFTSGSTGPPKGVRYLHKNFNAQIRVLSEEFKIRKGELDLVTLPVFSLFNPALGVTSVIPEMNPTKPAKASAEKLVQTIVNHQISSAFCSPVIGGKINDYCKMNSINLGSIRRIMLAGAPASPNLVCNLAKSLPRGEVIIPYGATEALPVSYSNHHQIAKLSKSIVNGEGSCLGKPVKDVSIQLIPVRNSPIPNESEDTIIPITNKLETGEICVSGDTVTDGYDQMPGATRDARFTFNSKIYHRMGDLGYWDENNNLRFLGRKAECIQTESGPLETERCEHMFNNIDGVNRCALIGIGMQTIKEPSLVVEKVPLNSNPKLCSEIYSLLRKNFEKFGLRRVFFEKKLPVDARHNAKIHRLSLSKKWTKRVLKNQRLGLPE
ncbi:MAG: fatty acid CoA ligase family protein [Opitutales bacterium]